VIHNNDLEDIELTKGQDGHYIFTQAQVGPGVSVVWRANVIESPVINVGTALAGNFRQGTALWQRSEAELRIAEQHEDFFVRNLVVILIEERLAQSILRPSAFVEITFDNEPPTP
jgi:HK97 family phage major capsid protein